MKNQPTRSRSAFDTLGFKETIAILKEEVKELYLADEIPWVIGYSGGKDSTATLQLIWQSLAELPKESLLKPVHVISTDTLVENPVVAAWVNRSLDTMALAAAKQEIPITPHRLTPAVTDSFWVNLIGKGYPSPRPKFRWCTERMKIQPSNRFINNVVQRNGEAILVLGTRKAESSARASVMKKYEKQRARARLSPNGSLPNCLVYTPVEDWSNDDVWMFIMQSANPWDYDNKHLLTMYQGASADGECPLIVDESTPSCGSSRFGCWVCTMVDEDKSMTAMIQNDEEKEWMLPLLELRNELAEEDRDKRDFRRMTGRVQLFKGRLVHGPYLQSIREAWLRKVLVAQTWVRENGPAEMEEIELISLAELHEIRRIWVVDKHEVEDVLPGIYEEVVGQAFPGGSLDDNLVFGKEEMKLLKDICGGDRLHFELTRALLDIERKFRTKSRRAGLFNALEKEVQRCFFTDEQDALEHALTRKRKLKESEKMPVIEKPKEKKKRQLPLLSDDSGAQL
jgi:DNA sulfur modification protein DndC